jgi:hypothetical protein
VTTVSFWRIRYASRPNSRGVSEIGVVSRFTIRRAGSNDRFPAASTAGRCGAARRTSARNRATSTMNENGFVM